MILMWNQEKAPQVDKKELRTFAITLFIALSILGGILFWRRGNVALIPLGIGLVLLVTGLLRPGILRPVHKAWMILALALGFITSHLILAIIYYLVFTPLGLIMRSLRKDPLQRKYDQEAATYWTKKEKKPFSKTQYEKMF
jgi:hypothetical protein